MTLENLKTAIDNADVDADNVVDLLIDLDPSDYASAKKLLKVESIIKSDKDFNKLIHAAKIKGMFGKQISNAVDLVDWYVDTYKIRVTIDKLQIHPQQYTINNQVFSQTDLDQLDEQSVDIIKIANPEYYRSDEIVNTLRTMAIKNNLAISDNDIRTVLDNYIFEKRKEIPAFVYSKILYSDMAKKEAEPVWDQLVEMVFDTTINSREFYKNILKKFIHQVKNKMLHNSTENHLMLVLTGKQGVGKSYFVKNFLKPVSELTANVTMSDITDDRMIDLWHHNVLVLDEMQYASRADIDVVKNIITATTLQRRPMRTNSTQTIFQKATFIGSSNKELDELIVDSTGVRRFIGLKYKGTTDYNTLNNIDYSLLWQSVDPSGDDYTASIRKEIIDQQTANTDVVLSLQAYRAGYFNQLIREKKSFNYHGLISVVESFKNDHGMSKIKYDLKMAKNELKNYMTLLVTVQHYDCGHVYIKFNDDVKPVQIKDGKIIPFSFDD